MAHKSPADRYDQIQASEPPDLDARVLAAIYQHVGKDAAISRVDLVRQVFGLPVDREQLANCPQDRQIRDAIARLQARYPILSSSGEGGYWIPGSVEEVDRYAAEIDSRALRLLEKSRALKAQALELFRGGSLQMRLPL